MTGHVNCSCNPARQLQTFLKSILVTWTLILIKNVLKEADLLAIHQLLYWRCSHLKPVLHKRDPQKSGEAMLCQDGEKTKTLPPNRTIDNENKKKEWILGKEVLYRNVFPNSLWKENPPLFFNASDKRCCPRFYSKGYCFEDCKRAHGVMNQLTEKEYHSWQLKCRAAAK